MADNIGINIEKLYEAYQKTLSAENTINDQKNRIYRFSELELPDKKLKSDRFKYNEELVRDDYVKSMDKLKLIYGKDSEGTVEKSRKHIYKLMEKFAETDERARAYFDEMQQQENNTIDSFGTDVDTNINKVGDYTDNTGGKSNGHSGRANVNDVASSDYNSGTESTGHSGDTSFADETYTGEGPTTVSRDHTSPTDAYADVSPTYTEGPVVKPETAISPDHPDFTNMIGGSIFAVPE